MHFNKSLSMDELMCIDGIEKILNRVCESMNVFKGEYTRAYVGMNGLKAEYARAYVGHGRSDRGVDQGVCGTWTE